MIVVFQNESLLPDDWRAEASAQPARCFNPGLLAHDDGWTFAYRVVIGPKLERRIALCQLDASLRVVPGSARPFSDAVQFAGPPPQAGQALTWFADPRLYRLQGRTYVYWNSGWHEPQNHQFLQEFDPVSLAPVGVPRELVLPSGRQKLEKNWALFEAVGRVYAVYSVNPHRVLTASLAGDGPIEFADAAPPVPNPGGYAQVHGGLRGGAPPQAVGSSFYSFCHSIENGCSGYEYVVGAYRFRAAPPFAPEAMPAHPLPLTVAAEHRRLLPKLNPAVGDVLYPAGAARRGGDWLISLGIDDERCAIAVVSAEAVDATLAPVGCAADARR